MLKRLAVLLPASLCALLGLSTGAQAATSFFLTIDGVQGESASKAHKGAIELQSFNWGVNNDPANKGKKGSSPNFFPVSVTDFVSSASPTLIEHAATGQPFTRAKIAVDKSGGEQFTFLELCFTDVVINSVQQSGHGGSESPTENFTFSYSKFGERYTKQSDTGGPSTAFPMGWDLVGNKTIGFQDVCGEVPK